MADQELSDLEILEIAKVVTKTTELGLRLRFDAVTLEGYEAANKVDLTKKEGNYQMLKDWWYSDRGTKEDLVEALRESGMGRLAKKVQTGILNKNQTGASASSGAAGTSDSGHQVNQKHGIDDATLIKIGKNLPDRRLDELAIALGISTADLGKYKQTNVKTHLVTSDGTVQMLKDWRELVAPGKQRDELKRALIEAKMIRTQEEFLP